MTKLGLRLGDIKGSSGSSYVELNGTKVFSAVYGPIEPETQQESATSGIVLCSLEDAWDASARLEGLQHKLQHTFTAAVLHRAYFKTMIRVAITCVSAGGSLADAATLAGSLALLDAGIQMNDFVVSCTVGFSNGEWRPFVESDVSVRIAILASKDEVVETEVIGAIDPATTAVAVEAAVAGCKELRQSVKAFLGSKVHV
jgi:ribonuclease PH